MSNIKLFESKQIRSTFNQDEQQWYFVVEDVIAALTDSNDPKQYVKKMRSRDPELSKGWVQIVPPLLLKYSEAKKNYLPASKSLSKNKKIISSLCSLCCIFFVSIVFLLSFLEHNEHKVLHKVHEESIIRIPWNHF